jgi:AraC-like DNA-binding protein
MNRAGSYTFGAEMKFFDNLKFATAGHQKNFRKSCDAPPLYYGLQFILSGEIEISVDHQPHQRDKGPVAFLTCPEYNYNYYTPATGEREHYWICFYGERVRDYLAGELFAVDPRKMLIRLANPELFLAQVQELVQLVRSGSRHEKAVLLLENLLLLLQDKKESRELPRRYSAQFDSLVSRIRLAPEKNWDFTAQAQAFSISLNHFNRMFRAFYDNSPQQFVIQCRLLKAADLLISTYYSIAEISHLVGIDNELYFSRLFKKKFQESPRNYRAEFGSS